MAYGKRSMECGFWVSTGRRCGSAAVAIFGPGGGSLPLCGSHCAYVTAELSVEHLTILGYRPL